jgi:hypothetical protein
MKSKIILSVLKIGATILFYFLLLITIVIAGNYILRLANNNPNEYISIKDGKYGNMFIDLDAVNTGSFNYSKDQLVRYKAEKSLYSVDIKQKSVLGYYYMLSTIVFLGLGLLVLWHFKNVFREIKLDKPFKPAVVTHLNVLAAVFIISDLLSFVNYFVLNALITNSIHQPRIKNLAEYGSGILIGLIILIVALVYKRGLEIYEENSLTV